MQRIQIPVKSKKTTQSSQILWQSISLQTQKKRKKVVFFFPNKEIFQVEIQSNITYMEEEFQAQFWLPGIWELLVNSLLLLLNTKL